MVRVGLLLAMLLAACQRSTPRLDTGPLEIAPTAVELPRTFVGFTHTVELHLTNHGVPWRPRWVQVTPPFSVLLDAPLADAATVLVAFSPTRPGSTRGTLTVGDDHRRVAIDLKGLAEAPPRCPAASDCLHVHFDSEAGTCVIEQVADGTLCEGACGKRCVVGACQVDENSCDDGDLCTTDQCFPATGCVHSPIGCPRDGGRCGTLTCNPRTGRCESATLDCDDHDPCTVDSCDPEPGCMHSPVDCHGALANACFANRCNPATGQCEPRGTGPASGSCDWLPEEHLAPVWSYRPAGSDATFVSGLLLDAAGRPYTVECATTSGASCTLRAFAPDGQIRFSLPFAGWDWFALVDDLLLVTRYSEQTVAAYRTSDGAPVWVTRMAGLFPPPASGAQITPGRFTALGSGSVALGLARPSTVLVSGIAVVDTATGTLRTWLDAGGAQWTSAIGDGQGVLYLQAAWEGPSGWLGRVDAIDAALGPLWSTAPVALGDCHRGCPRADVVGGGTLLGVTGTILDAATGQLLPGGPDAVPFDATSLLVDSGKDFTLRPFTDGACSGPRLARFSPATGAEETGCDFLKTSSRHLVLTATGSVLLLPDEGKADPLVEVSADAQAVAVLRLDMESKPSTAVLAPNRLYVRGVSPQALYAFDLPGRAPAEHGWITKRGNQQGTWSALP